MHFTGGDGICTIISILCGPKTESPVYLGVRSSYIPSVGSAVGSAEINWSPGENASGVSHSHVCERATGYERPQRGSRGSSGPCALQREAVGAVDVSLGRVFVVIFEGSEQTLRA